MTIITRMSLEDISFVPAEVTEMFLAIMVATFRTSKFIKFKAGFPLGLSLLLEGFLILSPILSSILSRGFIGAAWTEILKARSEVKSLHGKCLLMCSGPRKKAGLNLRKYGGMKIQNCLDIV